MKTDCIFCNIISGEIPSKPFADYDDILVIRDIAPKAPIHLLIMPKKHMHNLASVEVADMGLVARMMSVAQTIANTVPQAESFRLVMNNGAEVGQSVFHLHMHFLAGKHMSE